MSANKSSHTIKSIKVNMFRFNHHLGRAENKKCGQVLGGFVSRSARHAACSQGLHPQASRGEDPNFGARSEERRVGKECRLRRRREQYKQSRRIHISSE